MERRNSRYDFLWRKNYLFMTSFKQAKNKQENNLKFLDYIPVITLLCRAR